MGMWVISFGEWFHFSLYIDNLIYLFISEQVLDSFFIEMAHHASVLLTYIFHV